MVLGNTSLYKSSFTRTDNKQVTGRNESLFVESLDMIRENDRFFNSILRDSNVKVILAEASSKNSVYLQEFSFKEFIENVIEFFIKTIKKIFEKFKTLFYKFTDDDKYIKKYSDKLKNMKGEFELTYPRFNYTCFDTDIPNINLKNEFFDDYSRLEGKIKEISELKTKSERTEKMLSLEADVGSEYTADYYDILRQRTLKTNYAISEEAYADELYNVFRGECKQLTSKINGIETTMILNRYLNNKQILKDVENLKNDTIKAAQDIEKKIKAINLQSVNKYYTYDTNEEVMFSRILQKKISQVNEVCNIFVMAFSAKCDAVKEATIQDKKILLEAIKFINIIGGENR